MVLTQMHITNSNETRCLEKSNIDFSNKVNGKSRNFKHCVY